MFIRFSLILFVKFFSFVNFAACGLQNQNSASDLSKAATAKKPPTASGPAASALPVFKVEAYPDLGSAYLSALYRIELLVGGKWNETATYQYSRKSLDWAYHGGASPWVHWAKFGVGDAQSRVKVRVTRLLRQPSMGGSNPFKFVEIIPYRYGNAPVFTGDQITFEMKRDQNVYVNINNDTHDTLLISANPLKPDVPAGALYFGKGVHTCPKDCPLGANNPVKVDPAGVVGELRLKPNQNVVYIDAGAWVRGSFNISDVLGDVQFMGPGVISGELEKHEDVVKRPFPAQVRSALIHADMIDSKKTSVKISGVTLLASAMYVIRLWERYAPKMVSNVQVISPWTYNTDAFSVGANATIEKSVIFNNDDTVQPESGNVQASNLLLLGRNPFLVGYGYVRSAAQSNMRNIDVAMVSPYNVFGAGLDGASSDIVIENQTYRNIRIHGNTRMLMDLLIQDTEWGAQNPGGPLGNIKNVSFEDIILYGKQEKKSIVRGRDQNNRISLKITDLNINGTYVNNSNKDTYFDIDQNSASVDFKVTKLDTTECRVFATICPFSPQHGGLWYPDRINDSNLKSEVCMERAKEIKSWCSQNSKTPVTVTTQFYKNTVFQQGNVQ